MDVWRGMTDLSPRVSLAVLNGDGDMCDVQDKWLWQSGLEILDKSGRSNVLSSADR